MLSLSERILSVAPSPTQAAAARAQELKEAGRDIIAFTVGEPDFDTPKHVKDAAVKALDAGHTRYCAVGGIAPLKRAISEKLKRDQGLEYAANEIIVTNGGKHALSACFASLLNPGDEVVIPAPYWTSYPDMVSLSDGVPVIVETTVEDGYTLTPETLKRVVTPKTRAIVINSPSNPTGACYTREQLEKLVEAFKELDNHENIALITDEVYEYITYDGFEHVSIAQVAPELRENIIIVNAFSKAYAMTGWRIGYVAGPKELVAAMAKHGSQFVSNVCSFAQHAAAVAYEDGGQFPKMMREEFTKRLEIVCEAVERMPGIDLPIKPQGAFYAFLRVDKLIGKSTGKFTINSSQDFVNYILEEFDVVTVQGEAFGAPGAFRVSFALDTEQLKKGLERIIQAVEQLS